jgi:hypothetical protein
MKKIKISRHEYVVLMAEKKRRHAEAVAALRNDTHALMREIARVGRGEFPGWPDMIRITGKSVSVQYLRQRRQQLQKILQLLQKNPRAERNARVEFLANGSVIYR